MACRPPRADAPPACSEPPRVAGIAVERVRCTSGWQPSFDGVARSASKRMGEATVRVPVAPAETTAAATEAKAIIDLVGPRRDAQRAPEREDAAAGPPHRAGPHRRRARRR
jgi:hypothetical protein